MSASAPAPVSSHRAGAVQVNLAKRRRPIKRALGWAWRLAVLGPVPIWRTLLRRWHHADLARLGRGFDRAFYLRQIANPKARAQAVRAPELHYLLFGADFLLSPHPAFDLRATLDANPEVPRGRIYFDGQVPPPTVPDQHCPPPPGTARRAVLLLDHARGGGSSRFLALYRSRLEAEGYRVVAARRVGPRAPLFVVDDGGGHHVFTLGPDLAPVVARLGIDRLVLNHLIDLPLEVFARIPVLARALGLSYELLLHDYYLACPRVNLVDRHRRFCGLAEPAVCDACVDGSAVPVAHYRERAAALIAGADRVVVPSPDLADRLSRVFPDLASDLWEPEVEPAPLPPRAPSAGMLAIVVIGGLNVAKGFDVVLGLARAIKRRGAPVSITVMGSSSDDRALRRAGVEVLGRFREQDGDATLAAIGADLALFPAIWPETWSFTLTAALRISLPVVAFDIGAIADRLRRAGTGHIVPTSVIGDDDALLDRLLALRAVAA